MKHRHLILAHDGLECPSTIDPPPWALVDPTMSTYEYYCRTIDIYLKSSICMGLFTSHTVVLDGYSKEYPILENTETIAGPMGRIVIHVPDISSIMIFNQYNKCMDNFYSRHGIIQELNSGLIEYLWTLGVNNPLETLDVRYGVFNRYFKELEDQKANIETTHNFCKTDGTDNNNFDIYGILEKLVMTQS